MSNSHSEDDFIAFCGDIGTDQRTWKTLKIDFSHNVKQRHLLKNIETAAAQLTSARETALATFQQINDAARSLKTEAVSYIFTDNDILLFVDVPNQTDHEKFLKLEQKTAEILPQSGRSSSFMASEYIGTLKEFADEKTRTARQIRTISALTTNMNRRASINVKRKNRQLPLIMLVEDDRFTAAYTTQLLSKDYEVFHVRTGEEAIEYYMDYAPDAVFIDMHLPGMNGADTLQMIKAMDPDSYCVIQSVDSTERIVCCAKRDGANSYLRKPYNKERFLWTVQQSPHIRNITHTAR